MNNLKAFAASIMAILGLAEWSKVEGKSTLSAEDKIKLKNYGFSDVFVSKFAEELSADFKDKNEPEGKENKDDGKSKTKAEEAVNAALRATLADMTARLATVTTQYEDLKKSDGSNTEAISKKDQEITTLKEKITALSAAAENDPGKGSQHSNEVAKKLDLSDEKQLGGFEGEMFSLDRPYNLRAKAKMLEARGMMMSVKAESSLDYSTLKADLGAFYQVPWQDRLQSLLQQLPTIESIFPLESGYQDLAVLVNVWLGEFSQADNTASDFDNVVKGNYEFGDETLRMFSVMFAHKFKNLKELEKTWIGSLNKEGSGVIKWSFIEFILAETSKKLYNEREQRRINGVRKDPNLNTPGRSLDAADGVYEFIKKKVDGFVDIHGGKTVYQIKPFELGEITEANIGEKVYQGTSMIPAVVRDSGNLVLYMPSHMIVLYHKYNELHYGNNQDYKADIMFVKEYPSVKISQVPNADNHSRLIWTIDGNIHTYEDRPNEMTSFNLEQQDWTLKVWSNWKESIWAQAVGYKYTKKSEMDYSRQLIFVNETDYPSSYFIESSKDANPDAAIHSSIVTVANTNLFAISDIDNAEVGVVITLKCGSIDKGISISKADKFSLISGDWNPAVGDTIKIMKRADGKFIEIERATAAANELAFDADATTPSLKNATTFVAGTNTKATAITNFTDANEGDVYTIYGSGSNFASTIANSGNFVLTADISLTEGHYIKLVKSIDGKFYEVDRG
jgi:hypothetical protein